MNVLKFDLKWSDISEQDNPTYNYINGDKSLGRVEECLMITKTLAHEMCVGEGYTVTFVPKKGEVARLGLFWTLKNAEIFAESVSKII